jgi:hypothetical protein
MEEKETVRPPGSEIAGMREPKNDAALEGRSMTIAAPPRSGAEKGPRVAPVSILVRQRPPGRRWHDPLAAIDAEVRREIARNPSDPDPDAAAILIERATGLSVEQWSRRLGYGDWVGLFRHLPCIDSVDWCGDARGWRIRPVPGAGDAMADAPSPHVASVSAPRAAGRGASAPRTTRSRPRNVDTVTRPPSGSPRSGRDGNQPQKKEHQEQQQHRGAEPTLPTEPQQRPTLAERRRQRLAGALTAVPRVVASAASAAAGDVVVIRTPEMCAGAVTILERHGAIAVDWCGHPDPKSTECLGLIQACGPVGPCYVFDMRATEDLVATKAASFFGEGGLGRLLGSLTALKIVYDAPGRSDALWRAHGVSLYNVVDLKAKTFALHPDTFRAPLATLAARYGVSVGPYVDAAKAARAVDARAWLQRPLPEWMLTHAVLGVRAVWRLFAAVANEEEETRPPDDALSTIVGKDAPTRGEPLQTDPAPPSGECTEEKSPADKKSPDAEVSPGAEPVAMPTIAQDRPEGSERKKKKGEKEKKAIPQVATKWVPRRRATAPQ